jgi:hypothetical protein
LLIRDSMFFQVRHHLVFDMIYRYKHIMISIYQPENCLFLFVVFWITLVNLQLKENTINLGRYTIMVMIMQINSDRRAPKLHFSRQI